MRSNVMFFRPTLSQGGADRVTATLLRNFDRSRFDVSVALLRAEGEFLTDIGDGTRVHELGAHSLARAAVPLARLLRDQRPDVLFSTSSAANLVAVAAHVMTGRRGRLVLSERNALLRGHATVKRRVEVALKRALYRLADSVTVVSRGVGDELAAEVGIPRDKIDVVYNPVISDALLEQARAPADHPWLTDNVPVILAAGRLVPQKDYDTLFRAFAALVATRPARLLVLGDGPNRDALAGLARTLSIEASVQFLGFDKNPFRYMARCDVFVLSSRAEGLPGALIQAMACGAPAIATDCKHGPNEVIQDPGRDGILVGVGDVAGLTGALDQVLADDVFRAQLAERGRASAMRFDVPAALERYEAAALP